MELLLAAAVLSALGYGAYKAVRKAYATASEAVAERHRAAEADEAEQRRELAARQYQLAHKRRHNFLARYLQLALLQLDQAADFRRAASFAQKAHEVPLSFRQRQFRRFRRRFVQHFEARLRAGTDIAVLLESLTELLGNLGISASEAEYIR